METIRSFVSIGIPETPQIKDALGKLRDIRGIGVSKEVHLTLRFLGDVETKKLKELSTKMKALEEFHSFSISMKGMGAFPNIKEPRVVWIGADMGSLFPEILSKLDKILDSSSIDYDKKQFKAHITLGRVRDPSTKLTTLLTENRNLEAGSFDCRQICLMSSQLTPNGAKHSVIASYKLAED
jgi:2'-5' RNA ligase